MAVVDVDEEVPSVSCWICNVRAPKHFSAGAKAVDLGVIFVANLQMMSMATNPQLWKGEGALGIPKTDETQTPRNSSKSGNNLDISAFVIQWKQFWKCKIEALNLRTLEIITREFLGGISLLFTICNICMVFALQTKELENSNNRGMQLECLDKLQWVPCNLRMGSWTFWPQQNMATSLCFGPEEDQSPKRPKNSRSIGEMWKNKN